ncbi:MAG TPA: hypothetical protein EYP90_06145, partial [Chromatiaceae bacterium]|nr:hypothetical protein [Chromatiaceae bacterium]
MRREWDVSFYCLYDPILRRGRSFPHAPPASYEAASLYFLKAVEALSQGSLEDGMRFLGVSLHYIQDSASFPHVQPIHRNFSVRNTGAIRLDGYKPRLLGGTPKGAAEALSKRLRDLVAWTERRLSPLLERAGLGMEEAKRLCAKETMHPKVTDSVRKLLLEQEPDFQAAVLDCAIECAKVCADAIHTALKFAKRPKPEVPPPPAGLNLAFNPSFEEDDGDGVPDGWCVCWLDLRDRVGRAYRYRAGTHWERHVRTGEFSVLILWAPKAGIEWRQTWRRAIPTKPGQRLRLSCWVKTKASGRTFIAIEFYDAAYKPISRAESRPLSGDNNWTKLDVEAIAP